MASSKRSTGRWPTTTFPSALMISGGANGHHSDPLSTGDFLSRFQWRSFRQSRAYFSDLPHGDMTYFYFPASASFLLRVQTSYRYSQRLHFLSENKSMRAATIDTPHTSPVDHTFLHISSERGWTASGPAHALHSIFIQQSSYC